MGKFVSLHHHTTFSYMDGFGTPEEHFKAAADAGIPAIAMTEHGNVTSHVKAEKAGKEVGVKSIFGCELYTGAVGEDASRYKWHLTVLASTQTGLRNLNSLVSQGWAEGFYYEPTVSGEMLADNHEGLIVLSGCSGSKMATDLLGGKGTPAKQKPDYDAAKATALRFRDLLGDRFYLEAQAFPELEKTRIINQAWQQMSDETGIPLVVTGDVHYPKPADNEIQVLLHAIDRGGKNNTVEKQMQGWGYDIKLTTFADDIIVKKLMGTGLSKKQAKRALEMSSVIGDRINVEMPKLQELQFPSVKPAEEIFRKWLKKGWEYRGFHLLPKEERKRAKARLKYETEMIVLKGFVDYHLVVADVVKYAKDSGIPVGPARGSAAGSLVCYLLRITEVNPMLFPNLIFERYIDINRHDLPDIDLDFDDEFRWKIRQYLCDKYGEERVGNIGTFTNYRGKNSLDDIARVNSVPKWATDAIKEKLIERASGDLRGNATIEDTIAMFPDVAKVFEQYPVLYKAQRLEGNLKGFSVHAAGLVVANEPLTHSVAVYERRDAKTGEVTGNVLSIDKHDAEYINALKIDVLGLTTMGLIRRCLEMIGMSLAELYAIPLDDEVVFEGFKRNEVIGIFQFDGRAMRSVNREVKPDNFAEVCDINALARPGPLHSGAAAEYIMVKHGKKKAEILHPVVGRITAHTNSQIVYQEQILQVVRELGDFSWEEAALIRKLISKKQGEQAFNRMMEKFVTGAMKNGLNEAKAVKVWKQLVTAGAYAFNAAHCVSYGMLAYWCMWLKQNHPLEFYCASLQKFSAPNHKAKALDIMKEIDKKGIPILPPHPQESGLTWQIDYTVGGLRAGYTQVNGIGEATGAAMAAYKDEFLVEDWSDFTAVKGIGPVTMQKVKEFTEQDDPFGLKLLRETISKMRRWIWETGSDLDGLPFPGSKAEDVPYEAIKGEHVWLGVVKERNLKDIYELHRSRTGEELDEATVKEPQYINYVALTCEDDTGPLSVTIHRFGGLYERYKDAIWNMDIKRDLLLVKGYKRSEYRRAIYAKEIYVLNPEEIL